MCPECFLTLALAVTGVISTGGVTAAAVKILRDKKIAARAVPIGQRPELRSRSLPGPLTADPESQEEGEK
jgi:hypothetical protein